MAVFLVFIFLTLNTFVVIPPSMVGVSSLFGSVAEKTFSQGLHIKSPFARIHLFNIKTLLLDPAFQKVPTKEGLTVELDTAILYHIEPKGAREIFLSLGPRFEDIIIKPALFSAVRGLTSEYEAKALYTSGRTEIQRSLKEELSEKLVRRRLPFFLRSFAQATEVTHSLTHPPTYMYPLTCPLRRRGEFSSRTCS